MWLSKNRRFRKLQSGASELSRALGADLLESVGHRLLRLLLRVGGENVAVGSDVGRCWARALYGSVDGAPLRFVTPAAVRWLRFPSKRLFPSTFVRAFDLLAGVLPSKARSSRYRVPDSPPWCRGPCQLPESLCHILQGCSLTHGPGVKRHNSVVHFAEARARRVCDL